MKNLLTYLILLIVAAGCDEAQSVEEIISIEQPENNDNSLTNDVYSELRENTIYYSGKPIYTDAQLNAVGNTYGVLWENTGCVDNHDYDNHNEKVKMNLNKKNGNG